MCLSNEIPFDEVLSGYKVFGLKDGNLIAPYAEPKEAPYIPLQMYEAEDTSFYNTRRSHRFGYYGFHGFADKFSATVCLNDIEDLIEYPLVIRRCNFYEILAVGTLEIADPPILSFRSKRMMIIPEEI